MTKTLNQLATNKSPLKWAGGKRRLVHRINKLIPKHNRKRLIEPFVGGGSVFLNIDFAEYLLVDFNPDLIALFEQLKNNTEPFIECAGALFNPLNNQADKYYQLRTAFNQQESSLTRCALFMYLNRHGYNGLCRYNQKGQYNVPFGQYKRPYFPLDEIREFASQSKNATFISGDFSLAFEQAQAGDIIYCDPPYVPISKTSSFTAYSGVAFGIEDQQRLADFAEQAKARGITTIISNNYLPITKKLYKKADRVLKFEVTRTISCNGSIRTPAMELMALYEGT